MCVWVVLSGQDGWMYGWVGVFGWVDGFDLVGGFVWVGIHQSVSGWMAHLIDKNN